MFTESKIDETRDGKVHKQIVFNSRLGGLISPKLCKCGGDTVLIRKYMNYEFFKCIECKRVLRKDIAKGVTEEVENETCH